MAKSAQLSKAECHSLWIRSIDYSPKQARYCKHWHDFSPAEWGTLLAYKSEFINIVPIHDLNADNWFELLCRQPSLLEYCPILDEMPEIYDQALKKRYPWLQQTAKNTARP